MITLNSRQIFALIAASCLSMMIGALIMQYFLDMEPCPLCISQRVFVILVGLIAFVAFLHKAQSTLTTKLYALGCALMAIIGGGISTRHVWIQSLPEDEVPLCGPGLQYMFETRPMFDALALLFKGDGNCSDINFTLFGLSIPGWTLVCFAGLLVASIWIFVKSKPK